MNEEGGTKQVREASFPRVARQTPLQRMFLRRLQRLAALDRYGKDHLPFTDADTVLMRRSMFSTYRDCVELELEGEARAVLRAAAAMKAPGDVIDRSGG